MTAPKKTHPDAVASRLNPIIGWTKQDTLHGAACVAAFLARLQMDRADALFLGETTSGASPDPLTANETRGLGLIAEALAAALWFELEGRQGQEGGQS